MTQFLTISLKWPHVFIHGGAMSSDKQTEHSFNLHKRFESGLCNSKLCAIHIWEHTKGSLTLVWVLFATSMPLKFTCFAMICTVLLQTSQKAFLESAGYAPSQIINTESCNRTCLSKISAM